MKLPKFTKSIWFVAGAAFVFGVLLVLSIRFITYQPEKQTHYHANFAVYINGQQEEFKAPFYYQEVATSCNASEDDITPERRVHMHDNVNDVVHVHHKAVTWGNFFQNIGWVVDPRLIRTPEQLYLPDGQNEITFMLNGKKVDSAMRNVINDEDRLLIDFGDTSEEQLQKEFKSVATTAHKYDINQDPASCSGDEPATMDDRIKHMF